MGSLSLYNKEMVRLIPKSLATVLAVGTEILDLLNAVIDKLLRKIY